MLFVRQFVIAVKRACLQEVSVVTFSREQHGLKTFRTDDSIDVVVQQMYDIFAEGLQAAQDQRERSKRQAANAPLRNAEWRQVRDARPPPEAFVSTAAPLGDPNSLFCANGILREPTTADEITVVPRTPPKSASTAPSEPTISVVPKTPPKAPPLPKAPPAPKTPPTPPPWTSEGIHDEMPRAWLEPPRLNDFGRWRWDYQNGWVWRPDYDLNITNPYHPCYYASDDEIWEWMERGWNDFTMRHGIVNL